MHTYYGIWIDHSSATIIKSDKLAEMTFEHFESTVEPNAHGGETEENFTIVNQNKLNERRENELQKFCRDLVKHLTDADEIVVFGPSTAKFELKKEIENVHALAEKLKGVETTDKLSEPEMKEFMKKFFLLPAL